MQADSEARVMVGARESVSVRTINPGVIPMDAIFSPVLRVSYRVENSRIGANTEFDKLCLEVETNGSISPEMALGLAAKIMLDHFSLLVSFKAGDANENSDAVLPPNVDLRLLIRIGDLDLTVRSSNCLKNYNVIYNGDLITKSEAELMRIPNLGKKSIQELKSLLDRLGMSLAKDVRWPIENAEDLSKKFELDIQKLVAGLV
jgi:DNA-directed RNA polymerase subunit alpha